MPTQNFQSETSIFLSYLILKIAPLIALIYYIYNWNYALLALIALIIIIISHSKKNNYHFRLEEKNLVIYQSLSFRKKEISIPYEQIKSIHIKYAKEKDSRQWLKINTIKQNNHCYRCDWLHTQDPPSEEEHHELPEGELFDLLAEEDFYKGSLNELGDLLTTKGILVV